MLIILSIAGATIFGLLAVRYGAESRPELDERPVAPGPHRPWI